MKAPATACDTHRCQHGLVTLGYRWRWFELLCSKTEGQEGMPMGSTSRTAHWGVSLPVAHSPGWEHSQKHNAVHMFCGASNFLCKPCSLTAGEVQVFKCSFPDKHLNFAHLCLFLTRCGLAVFNAPFLPPGSVPTVCFSLSYSLQQPSWVCPSPLSVCLWSPQHSSPALWRGHLLCSRTDGAQLPSLGISSGRCEGLTQKAAQTRKSCPSQSVHIREPLLGSALRHVAGSANN